MIIIELLNPKTDYVFKRIFGHLGNEEITKGLLRAITKEDIQEIELDSNPITEKELLDDKVGILDIKATLNNNINCDIEMQVVDKKNMEKRILFYWSKMYTSSIKSGNDYNHLKRGIAILITDYNLEKLKDIKRYMTKWNIRKAKKCDIILTGDLEIYIIETNKVGNNSEGELDSWLKFINNPEENVDMENKEIKKAKEVLEKISQDKHERYLAELRQKYIMDQKATEDAGYDKGLKAGIEQGMRMNQEKHERYLAELRQKYIMDQKATENAGYDKGLKVGIEQGTKQNKLEIAKKMKQKNMEIKDIIELTGLTIEEIKKL